MSETAQEKLIRQTVARQRAFFRTGATRPVAVRLAALQKLKAEIKAREPQLLAALKADLHKSAHESYMCELGLNLDELGYLIRKTPSGPVPSVAPPPWCSTSPKAMSCRSPTAWCWSCPPGTTPIS